MIAPNNAGNLEGAGANTSGMQARSPRQKISSNAGSDSYLGTKSSHFQPPGDLFVRQLNLIFLPLQEGEYIHSV